MNCSKCKEKKVVKNERTKNYKQGIVVKWAVTVKDYSINQRGCGNKKHNKDIENIIYKLLKRIVSIDRSISKPIISKGKTYEFDVYSYNRIYLITCISYLRTIFNAKYCYIHKVWIKADSA